MGGRGTTELKMETCQIQCNYFKRPEKSKTQDQGWEGGGKQIKSRLVCHRGQGGLKSKAARGQRTGSGCTKQIGLFKSSTEISPGRGQGLLSREMKLAGSEIT